MLAIVEGCDMIIKNDTNDYVTPLTFSYWQQSGSTVTTSTKSNPQSIKSSDFRMIYRVDPFHKVKHGPYQRSYLPPKIVPVNSSLVYYQKPQWSNDPIKWRASIAVTGWVPVPGAVSSGFLRSDQQSRTALINRAIKGALEEQVNLALFFAELDKTSSLLAGSAKKIATSAKLVRNGRFAAAARELGVRKPRGAKRNKTFADNWLKFSFGFGPIVQDMAGMLSHLQRGSRALTITARARQTTPFAINSSRFNTLLIQEAINQHKLYMDVSVVGTDTVKEQVVLKYRPKSEFWDQVSRLGFINPGQLAWQAYPLTFVADWFVNVGDWLAALNMGLTLDYLTGSYSEHHSYDAMVQPTFRFTDKRSNLVYSPEVHAHAPSKFHEMYMRRQVLIEEEVLVRIVLDAPTSVNQAITAIALVVQRLK
jgi:hypothetical protein